MKNDAWVCVANATRLRKISVLIDDKNADIIGVFFNADA